MTIQRYFIGHDGCEIPHEHGNVVLVSDHLAAMQRERECRAKLVEALEALRKVLKEEASVKVTADFAGQMMFGEAVLKADAALAAAEELGE